MWTRSKYGAKKTEYNGFVYDSKREAEYARDLDIMKQAGLIRDYERQPVFLLQERFMHNGKVIRPIRYVADFRITYPDGRVEVVDVKGFMTPEFKIKQKMFYRKYPDLDLILVK